MQLGCAFLIISTIIAFAIHPALGVIWLVAQIVAGINDQKENKDYFFVF
jgi:hypothetical protein